MVFVYAPKPDTPDDLIPSLLEVLRTRYQELDDINAAIDTQSVLCDRSRDSAKEAKYNLEAAKADLATADEMRIEVGNALKSAQENQNVSLKALEELKREEDMMNSNRKIKIEAVRKASSATVVANERQIAESERLIKVNEKRIAALRATIAARGEFILDLVHGDAALIIPLQTSSTSTRSKSLGSQ